MRVGCISESVEVDKGLIIAHQARLNDILNIFSKKYNKCFYIKHDEYEMCETLWCNTSRICALDMNEHFTEHILTRELCDFCEKYLKENSDAILKN